ncbi:hypothetical protein [Streptosporangium saharense]|uniref:Uncharacterized protein n=1 Tax=Streptosporangium saharense TaxID=1706840 RepID=A0A7W7VST3_9ACTN|nr:hypothetical protein [Streptosporangium saharense]MBB4920730.1 hypothetical protein [Streptosporangium saharense]
MSAEPTPQEPEAGPPEPAKAQEPAGASETPENPDAAKNALRTSENPKPAENETGDDEDGELDRPLRERMAAEDRERHLREANLRDLYGEYGDGPRAGRDAISGGAYRVKSGNIYHADRMVFGGREEEGRGGVVHLAPNRRQQLARVHVPTASYERLAALLRDEPVVALRGGRGSGRMVTGWMALLDRRRTAQAPVGWVRDSVDPLDLTEERLDEGGGYVLDATGRAWTRASADGVFQHLAAVAATRNARIVVLVDRGFPGTVSAVDHDPPPPGPVFERWLSWELGGAAPAETAVHDGVREYLREGCTLADVVQLAKDAAEALRAGGGLDDALAGQPRRLRAHVATLLSPEHDVRRRCFLLGVAVLNELPSVTITRAALQLTEILADPDHTLVDPESWDALSQWVDYAQASQVPDERGRGSRISLRRSTMASVVLEVAWREHPTIREALLAWLGRLCEHPDQAVRIKAAHAIGRLVTYDFDVIDGEFLRRWSVSGRTRDHWLAAWAIEAALLSQHVAPRLLDRLRDWAGGSAAKQAIVARAYGLGVGVEQIDRALPALRQIALRSSRPATQDAVSRTLMEIYGPDTAVKVLSELAEWAVGGHPGLRRTAALAMTRLASGVESGTCRLLLAEFPADKQDWAREHLVSLWENALRCGLIARMPTGVIGRPIRAAWDVFAEWVGNWATVPGVRPVVEAVFEGAVRNHLRGPLRLHLRHWYLRRVVDIPLYHRLDHHMKGTAGS